MLRTGLVIPSSCCMRYLLPKQKKQSSDVKTFDWLKLRHMEKYDKKRTLKSQNQLFRTFWSFNNGLGPLSSYLLQKTSIQSSSCNSFLLPGPVANSRCEVAPLQRRSTGTRENTRRARGAAEVLSPENVFEHAIGYLT